MSNTINDIIKEEYPQEITSYKPIRIIERGSFGSLYEAIIISGNHKDETVAVKEIKLEQLDEKSLQNFKVIKIIYNYI